MQLTVTDDEVATLIVAAQRGMEQLHNAIFDAAYSLIDLEKREGSEVAFAAAAPIEAVFEVAETEEQKALYEMLYRATNEHPFPDIWRDRRPRLVEILATYGAKQATA